MPGLGFLNNIILTPSHHRVHHARNPFYMDTNFCNLLNIWDKVFGTYVNEKKEIPVEYGITRKMKPNNFPMYILANLQPCCDVKKRRDLKINFCTS